MLNFFKTIKLPLYFVLGISILPNAGLSQVIERPVSETKSHAELIITSIEINGNYTIFHLKTRNMLVVDGWACVDQRTVIRTSDNLQHSLIRAENIPLCPERHYFDSLGEVLEFTLYFPAVDSRAGPIDLVEQCDQSCFFFKGIILDNKINQDIHSYEKAFELYRKKEYEQALPVFEGIIREIPAKPSHVYGFSYYYLILGNYETGKLEKASFWYTELRNSGLADKNSFIKRIEELGIFN